LKKQIKTNSFYERYSSRYLAEIDDLNKEKSLKIRKNANFDDCAGLSNEIKEILKRHKPASIGEARQLPGMTPAAANVLLRYVKK
jgi:tRNA uridine 5-carboxymethylaminomethyl modification enzyme